MGWSPINKASTFRLNVLARCNVLTKGLDLNLNFNTTGEFELHQSINSLGC